MSLELRFHHTGGRVYRYEQTEESSARQLLKTETVGKSAFALSANRRFTLNQYIHYNGLVCPRP
jgi:hypothetical protein